MYPKAPDNILRHDIQLEAFHSATQQQMKTVEICCCQLPRSASSRDTLLQSSQIRHATKTLEEKA